MLFEHGYGGPNLAQNSQNYYNANDKTHTGFQKKNWEAVC